VLYFAIKPETVEALKDMDHAPPGVRLFSEFFKYAIAFENPNAYGGAGCGVREEAERGSLQRLIRIRDMLRL
jgi:hypothetical protein